MILQNCLCVEECASDVAKLSTCGQCASDLAELPGGMCMWRSVPVIWQNCLCQCFDNFAELSVCGEVCQ